MLAPFAFPMPCRLPSTVGSTLLCCGCVPAMCDHSLHVAVKLPPGCGCCPPNIDLLNLPCLPYRISSGGGRGAFSAAKSASSSKSMSLSEFFPARVVRSSVVAVALSSSWSISTGRGHLRRILCRLGLLRFVTIPAAACCCCGVSCTVRGAVCPGSRTVTCRCPVVEGVVRGGVVTADAPPIGPHHAISLCNSNRISSIILSTMAHSVFVHVASPGDWTGRCGGGMPGGAGTGHSMSGAAAAVLPPPPPSPNNSRCCCGEGLSSSFLLVACVLRGILAVVLVYLDFTCPPLFSFRLYSPPNTTC
mmetsp:Transcript_4268/g.7035  ORF Transcript_4268/g.7035 Transcript_4268/m.7035 type:complete len:304 (-) Transcript_4268:7-918(-)